MKPYIVQRTGYVLDRRDDAVIGKVERDAPDLWHWMAGEGRTGFARTRGSAAACLWQAHTGTPSAALARL